MENETRASASVRRSKEQIQEIVKQWQQSGKNKRTFCEENKLNYMTFIGWSNRLKQRKKIKKGKSFKGSGFVPVIPSTRDKGSSVVFAEIRYSNGCAITLQQSVPAEYLHNLVYLPIK
jgi:hypothetical protein